MNGSIFFITGFMGCGKSTLTLFLYENNLAKYNQNFLSSNNVNFNFQNINSDKVLFDIFDGDLFLEQIILSSYNLYSIKESFSNQGEIFFRYLEKTAYYKICDYIFKNYKQYYLHQKLKPLIVSGGGFVYHQLYHLQEIYKQKLCNYKIINIYLHLDFDIIWNRLITAEENRPLFNITQKNNLYNLYLKRLPFYQQNATYVIDANKLSISDLAQEFISLF